MFFDASPKTPAYDRLEILSTFVEAYEEMHYPIESPAPIDCLLVLLDQSNKHR